MQLVSRYGDSKCVDSRDKVYALLSLLPNDDIAFQYVFVDYSQSAWNIFYQMNAMCCYNPLAMTRHHSLSSLIDLAQLLDFNTQNQEVRQFLQRRLQSWADPEPRSRGVSFQDRFITLPIMHLIRIRAGEQSAIRKQDSMYRAPPDIRSLPYAIGALTGIRSAPDALAHDNGDFRLPRTQDLTIQRPPMKLVYPLGDRYRVNRGNRSGVLRHGLIITNFLVSVNTLEDDVVAEVHWKAQEGTEVSGENTASWAVLRPITETSDFDLVCWAIPEYERLMARGPDKIPSYSLTADPEFKIVSPNIQSTLNLHLHQDDLLAFVAIAREGVQALVMPATTTATESRAVLSEEIMNDLSDSESKV
ncbi:hypothetical protein V8E51_007747 [Hyaloscypha variabilis]